MCNRSEESEKQVPSLIAEARHGSSHAFEDLLNLYAPLVNSMTEKMLWEGATEQDREDFHQEALISFFRAMNHFDVTQDSVSFGAYAKRCIRNGLVSYLRTVRKYGDVLPLEDDAAKEEVPDPGTGLVERERYRELCRQVSNTLSEYENRVWWLYLSGRTASEIATLFGKDERSVQNAVYRIRRKLRTVIPCS